MDTVHCLRLLYSDQGKLRKAEDMLVRALAGYQKVLGPEHAKTIKARRNLVNLQNTPKSKMRQGISRLFKKSKRLEYSVDSTGSFKKLCM